MDFSSSQLRVWIRPSIATCCPLPRNWPQISARRSQVSTLWYLVRSLPPGYSLVARLKVSIALVCAIADDRAMKHPVASLRKSKVTSDRHVSWDVQEGEIRAMATRAGDAESLIFLSDWGRSGR